MARTQRKISATQVYHAVWRGNNKKQIFFDDQDYQQFFDFLREKKQKYKFSLYAWCLMPNHVHLLLKEGPDPLESIFRGLGASFVYWYNQKYRRFGHLFQGRYQTEPVEDLSYFLNVVRYIHVNPVKGHICTLPEEYPYSSYRKIINDERYKKENLIFQTISRDEFIRFHQEKVEDICLDIEESEKKIITDDEILALLARWVPGIEIPQIKELPCAKRTPLLADLLEIGASYRQINRLTGINMSVIRAVAKEVKSKQ